VTSPANRRTPAHQEGQKAELCLIDLNGFFESFKAFYPADTTAFFYLVMKTSLSNLKALLLSPRPAAFVWFIILE